MNRILLLMTCVVSLVAAGVLDVKIMNRINQQGSRVTNPIARMSQSELQRQKFLLDVLQNINQQTNNRQIIELGQTLVDDPNQYFNGIDDEMAEVIQLARQQQLLSPNDIYTIRNDKHVRQMRGIYRLLVRSLNWNTLQRNIAHLRMTVNPVLLVNALLLAIRDREDTQNLVLPAIQEILPELYVDEDVVRKARSINLNMLTNGVETIRPTLLDLIGLGKRAKLMKLNMGLRNSEVGMIDKSQLWMPWHEMRMQMALQKKADWNPLIDVAGEKKVILPIQRNQLGVNGLDLLTEDIGLKTFVQGLINNLLLEEDTNQQIDRNNNFGQLNRNNIVNQKNADNHLNINDYVVREALNQDIDSNVRVETVDDLIQARGIQNRQWRNNQVNQVEDLPSTDINSDRLLHVSRRRLNNISQGQDQALNNKRDRFMNVVHNGGVSEGRRVMGRIEGKQNIDNDVNIDNIDWMDMISGNVPQITNKQRLNQNRLSTNQNGVDDLPTTTVDDERLLHVNRRRLNEDIVNNNILPMRFSSIGEGRHVDSKKNNKNRENHQNINIDTKEEIRQSRQMFKQQDSEQDKHSFGGMNRVTQQDVIDLVLQRRLQQLSKDELVELIQLISQTGLVGLDDEVDLLETQKSNLGKSRSKINERLLTMNQNRMDDIEMQQIERQRKIGGIPSWVTNENDIDERVLMGGRRKPRSLSADDMTVNNNRDMIENLRGGEILMHTLQQLVARINLERISLGEQDVLTSELVNSQRLNNPRLLNVNNIGQNYALRMNEMRLDSRQKHIILDQINQIERRLEMVIRETLDEVKAALGINSREQQMQVNQVIGDVLVGRLGKVGILQILRDLLQSTNGQNGQQENRQTLLGIAGVTLNDPVVQHLLRRIVMIVDRQRQQQLGSYKTEDLVLQGVTINDVRVDKLTTFIDESDIDLVNLVNTVQKDINVNKQTLFQKMVVARQQRLNHKDFNIDIDVTSDRNQRVVIRTLLGPKTDINGQHLSLNDRRQNFIVLDATVTDLQIGRNRIVQNSRDITWTARDTTPLTEIYQQVLNAITGEVNTITNRMHVIGQTSRLPHRLLLPRGRVGGMQMELLVIITPVETEDLVLQRIVNPKTVEQLNGIGISTVNLDRLPLGFPLDRHIQNEMQILNLPNIKLVDVIIQHDN